MREKYVVVWFEGDDVYYLVDRNNNPVILNKQEAEEDTSISEVIKTEAEVNDASDDVRYAILTSTIQEMFGVEFE